MAYLLSQECSEYDEEGQNESIASFDTFRMDLAKQLQDGADADRTLSLLNGAAAAAVRQLVSLEQRRKDGIFFTSHCLAEKLISYVAPELSKGASAFDPTCGAGDLLLAAAKAMHLHSAPSAMLSQLSTRIKGLDLHHSFVEAAKLRLRLMTSLTHRSSEESVAGLFPDLKVQDSLNGSWNLDGTECILLNPPFGQVCAPPETKWGSGRVQRSALFIDKALSEMQPGQHAVAILPDVLRSGTNYIHWRKRVAQLASIHAVESVGKFDATTDVDVFILHLQRGNGERNWPEQQQTNVLNKCIGDFCTVRTGPLVAYREPNKGPWRPYLDCTRATPWCELPPLKKRRFRGTVVSGPFVVVRRTSSPSDAFRTVASIVNDECDVAVENHLIVIKPNDGSLETCRRLLAYFNTHAPTQWLNSRIRCRHLTVSAVRDIPFGGV